MRHFAYCRQLNGLPQDKHYKTIREEMGLSFHDFPSAPSCTLSLHLSAKGHSQSNPYLGRRADGKDRGPRDVAALIQQVLHGGERLQSVSQ